MLKCRFLKNSAKVLTFSVGLLYVSNLILLLSSLYPGFVEKLGWFSSLPDVSVYVFTFLTYLALNDEKAAHRKTKDIKSQKKLKALKAFLVFVFVFNFFKMSVSAYLKNAENIFCDVLSSLLLTVSSFSFFMLLLSLWYFFRDKNEGSLKIASAMSVAVSTIYAVIKFLFELTAVREFSSAIQNNAFFESQKYRYIMCLLQYAVNIVMLLVIKFHYEKQEEKYELEEKDIEKKPYPEIIECIETEKGYGIDSVDDLTNGYIE